MTKRHVVLIAMATAFVCGGGDGGASDQAAGGPDTQAWPDSLLAVDRLASAEVVEPAPAAQYPQDIDAETSVDVPGTSERRLDDPLEAIEISGFGDFIIRTNGPDEVNTYNIGQMEVDLETSLDEKVVVGAAVAYDDGNFVLGAFTVDLHLFGEEEAHFRRSDRVAASGILAGQFDVPFGIDLNVYPSIDRKLVSTPLVVEQTHGGWNDFGVQGYVETDRLNAAIYATNGFGYAAENGGEESGDVEMRMAVGTRVGLRAAGVEIGGSWAGFLNSDRRWDCVMGGGDIQMSRGSVSLKGEYITRQICRAGGEAMTDHGFYGQGLYDFGKTYVVTRFGRFIPDGGASINRLSAGAGWVILEGCELRFEYQANSPSRENQAITQIVVSF